MTASLSKILPPDRAQQLEAIGIQKQLAPQEYFLHAGDIPSQVAFVHRGLFRYVYLHHKGDEFTKGVLPEGNFISSYSAMILNRPSHFSIEALEPSEILAFKWASFLQLVAQDSYWLKFLLQFVEKGYIIKEKRERDLLLLDAESRYREFLAEFPGLDQRLTQGIIASYLGIKPETLSRIRRRITF